MKDLILTITNNLDQIKKLLSVNYCLVGSCLVQERGVIRIQNYLSVFTYQNYFGSRIKDPRFVGIKVNASTCFVVATLAGIIPHLNRKVEEKLSSRENANLTRDLSGLAKTIDVVTANPAIDIASLDEGNILMMWNSMSSEKYNDSLAFYQGVGLWRNLLE